jgi:hypothetical protein
VGLQFKRTKLTLKEGATFVPAPHSLPLEPAEGGHKVWKWSVWDAGIDVRGPLPMQGFLDFVASAFARSDVSSVMFGTTVLYTAMAFMKKAQKEARLKSTPVQLIKQLLKDAAPDFAKNRVLEIAVFTNSDEEFGVLPSLLYHVAASELETLGEMAAEGPPPQPAAITPAAASDAASA